MGTSIFGRTVLNFWLTLILILFFSLVLRWFPSMGYIDPTQDFFDGLQPFVSPWWCERCLPAPWRRV
jgi:ABC-type dipeptide/oligopeptide/nickel transport system permease component